MEAHFAKLDAECPDNLFTFIANAETVAGELTKFALQVARRVGTLEELKAMTPAAMQHLGAEVGISPEGTEKLVAACSTPDARFDHPVVKPMPRWALLVGEIFDLLDADKNGTLDLGEYMGMASMGASPFSFFFADKDGNGTVDAAEFLALHLDAPEVADMSETDLEQCCLAMKSHLVNRKPMPKSQIDRPALLTKLFEAFDADGDGEVDYFEFQQYTSNPEMEEIMAVWFSAIDSQGNGDGSIQLAEWLRTMGMLNQHMTDMKFEAWLMGIIYMLSQ